VARPALPQAGYGLAGGIGALLYLSGAGQRLSEGRDEQGAGWELADIDGERRRMKVWIDQDLCTGDGLCEEIAPAVFTLLDDGLAYVKEGDDVKNEPGGSAGMALVPEDLEDAVVEASEECPGECIFIERE
jgi:ferredoxin